MEVEVFFQLFLKELEQHKAMQQYYKFLNGEKSFNFRKNYFVQRLQYIYDTVRERGNVDLNIWDCGCGYGTTCLFLAMNGYKVYGSTLEFYIDEIEKRKSYWRQHGNVDLFRYDYKNLFEEAPVKEHFDFIIVQDTLHHLEPINDALSIFQHGLARNGKLIAIEENGDNIIQSMKLYKLRGNKRIITIWDERLQKNILLGNENIRGLDSWRQLFTKAALPVNDQSIKYIRYYLPFYYKQKNDVQVREQEQQLAVKSRLRKKYFFFGLNFTASPQHTSHS
ncbi:class I SAM-dependent methyltransferase [Chitinophaga rhizophila]|uniref:Methyltransferase domain-containing protein n=1 Tax=Chitinophaga rhizophila TaxID=2866212 RepID=A0ABS7GFI6_9BACT|nr:methyltransferase [Chitinophaga rhizophila]MBW8686449.1 methyltransferase domain-containing protein [Chitinophaga rhizophila]